MADVKCPSCGTMNPAGQELCRTCQARLDAAASYQPGQLPTKKTTAELEPILPQWLRDARNQARSSAQEDGPDDLNQAQEKKDAPVDLLAGLQAQAADDEDDVPDWLSNITGQSGKGKKDAPEGSNEVRWVELGGGTEELSEPASKKKDSIPVGQAPVVTGGENELPPWLANVLSEQEESKQDTFSGWLQQGIQADEQTAEPKAPAAEAPADETPARDAPFPHFESPTAAEWSNRPSVEQSPAIRRPEGFAPFEGGLPDWMKTKPLGQKRGEEPEPPPSEELPDWLKNIDSGEPQATEESPFEGDAQSQPFAGFGARAEPQSEVPASSGFESPPPAETPDWLKNMGSDEPATAFGSAGTMDDLAGSAGTANTPDWLSNLGAGESGAAQAGPASEIPIGETPDWMKSLGGEAAAPAAQPAGPAGEIPFGETPDWLKSFGGEEPAAPAAQPAGPASEISFGETPDWLKNLGGEEAAAAAADPAPAVSESSLGESADWLQNLGGQAPAAAPASEPASEIPFGETPDWLKDLGGIPSPDASTDGASSFSPSAAFASAEPAETPAAAFTPESRQNVFQDESLSRNDLDSLFTEMPDWLTGVAAEEPGAPSGGGDTNVIAPGSLPSWVEAMRPVESSSGAGGIIGDQSLETRGPLAGLHGVLPAVPFAGPTSKPRAYSIKLTASEEQQSHAALLEEVLGAETVPVPIVTHRNLAAQQMLRLVTAVIPLLIVPLMVLAGTQLFPLPASADISPKVNAGLQGMWSIPEGSPVLVVFDYEPALAGEMETLAGPLIDQMILLKQPRLTFLSTSPAGPVLAENFFTRLERRMGDYAAYGSGSGYVNLGYLPGELAGVRAFAQNPPAAMPVAVDGSRPWLTPALGDVQQFSQFTAIIVLTDSPQSGRTWIEQVGPSVRGASPLVVAASAQTGPLLTPYFESGQVTLLFTGLRDAALLEQVDADVRQILSVPATDPSRPGIARQYWDAYNLGLILAVIFILGGSGLSLLAARQDRLGKD